jgi:hypothetical protein
MVMAGPNITIKPTIASKNVFILFSLKKKIIKQMQWFALDIWQLKKLKILTKQLKLQTKLPIE